MSEQDTDLYSEGLLASFEKQDPESNLFEGDMEKTWTNRDKRSHLHQYGQSTANNANLYVYDLNYLH